MQGYVFTHLISHITKNKLIYLSQILSFFLFLFQIGDLGLSKVKQKTLVSGGVRGTLPWMAPELLSGKSNMVSEKVTNFFIEVCSFCSIF